MSTDHRTALRDLRRTRQRRRLGDIEWFDVAYRVYLFALGGMVAVVLASDAIGGFIGDDVSTDEILTRSPAILGVAVAVAVGLGCRSGADGGPVAVEVADIRHVLLAPIDRRTALLRPIVQRFRSSMFSFGLAVAVLGQFVARDVEGSRPAWAAAGALFGAVLGAAFVAAAVIAHALRMPRWMATAVAAVGIGWQGAAAWATWHDPASGGLRAGPANLLGSVALWGIRQRAIDVVGLLAVAVAVVVALALGGKLRIEPLMRRGDLVSQLRFAATMQDLRTVVLLRRQLRAETLRARPWGRRRAAPRRARPRSRHGLIWLRGLRSLRRLPASRLVRIAVLAIAGGVSASLTVSSSMLYAIGVVAAVFLLGMESIEPLSQEVDRPDITDGLPIERGTIYAHHLVAPSLLLAIAGLGGAAAASVVEPAHAAAAVGLAIPVAWGGAIGPVVAAVLDAPTPIAVADTTLMGAPRSGESTLVPPEFAGFSHAFSTFMPVVLSGLGVVPVLAMRVEPTATTAVRSAIGVALAIWLVTVWIRRRDGWGIAIRRFFEEGRAARQDGAPA